MMTPARTRCRIPPAWQRDRRISHQFEAAQASRKHGMNVLMGAPISCAAVRTPATWRPVNWRSLPAGYPLFRLLPRQPARCGISVADDESNRFTLPQAVKLVTKIRRRRLISRIAG